MISYEELCPEFGCVIGEIACGHEGDMEKFKELICCVSDSSAQIIKFQIFVPRERATPNHPEWKIFNDLALTEIEWQEAIQFARERNLTIFADIFGETSFQMAKNLGVDGFKIHSEDFLNSHFIAKVASEGKILIIGVGGAHRIEIYKLLNFLKTNGLCQNIILMPGVQTFPTPLAAHSLEEISDLANKYNAYGIKVGFADHLSGDHELALTLPLMGLAKGACVIEKHVTVSRSYRWEDYQSALENDEFHRFVRYVKDLAPLLGQIGPLNSFEESYRKVFKKIPVTRNDRPAGYTLQAEDIEYLKHPGLCIPLPSTKLVNKKLQGKIVKGSPLRSNIIEGKVAAIIVARCNSERLPGKAVQKICGRETIALLIERIKRCRNLDMIILATSTHDSDDILEEIAIRENVLPYRGSLRNLSLRFYEAAKHYGAEHIVRITGDDILRDEIMIDEAIDSHLSESCDVTFTDNMPYGLSSEVFTLDALETILKTASVPENTEYLEWYLENTRYFSVNHVKSDYTFSPSLRLTLDYEEDFKLFTQIFEKFYPENPEFKIREVLAWLEDNPTLMDINKHKTPKFMRRELDVSLNI